MNGSVLQPQPVGIPLPQPTATSSPYWDAAQRGELLFQSCESCGLIPCRPVPLCGRCADTSMRWRTSSGRGSLYSWTVVWRPQQPAFRTPYAPAIVEMEEGWWLMTSVIGCHPEDLQADMLLRIVFHPAGGEVWLPYAEPDPPS